MTRTSLGKRKREQEIDFSSTNQTNQTNQTKSTTQSNFSKEFVDESDEEFLDESGDDTDAACNLVEPEYSGSDEASKSLYFDEDKAYVAHVYREMYQCVRQISHDMYHPEFMCNLDLYNLMRQFDKLFYQFALQQTRRSSPLHAPYARCKCILKDTPNHTTSQCKYFKTWRIENRDICVRVYTCAFQDSISFPLFVQFAFLMTA